VRLSSLFNYRDVLSSSRAYFHTDVLQKRPTTPTTKRYAISYMRNVTESFKYTRAVLATLDKQVRAEVQRLGGNAKLDALLEQLRVPEAEEGHS